MLVNHLRPLIFGTRIWWGGAWGARTIWGWHGMSLFLLAIVAFTGKGRFCHICCGWCINGAVLSLHRPLVTVNPIRVGHYPLDRIATHRSGSGGFQGTRVVPWIGICGKNHINYCVSWTIWCYKLYNLRNCLIFLGNLSWIGLFLRKLAILNYSFPKINTFFYFYNSKGQNYYFSPNLRLWLHTQLL